MTKQAKPCLPGCSNPEFHDEYHRPNAEVPKVEKENEDMSMDYNTLKAERDALRAEVDSCNRAFVEMNAVFEATMRAIRGDSLTDFDTSHGAVYEAMTLRAELAAKDAENQAQAEELASSGRVRANGEIWSLEKLLKEHRVALSIEKAAREKAEARVRELEDLLVLMRGSETAWESEVWTKAIKETDAILGARAILANRKKEESNG